MKKSIAMKWVKALRSGKYIQGKIRLKSNDEKFCCLGVLCDISKKSRWTKDKRGLNWYNTSEKYLPTIVQKYSGIKTSSGVNKKLGRSLISLNDSGDFTFNDIADYIEKEYKDL